MCDCDLLACLVDNLLQEIWELLHYGDRLAGGQAHPVHRGGRVVSGPEGGRGVGLHLIYSC